jgi:hypothetical protein
MTQHSALGASSAHRWMNCPGSVQLSSGVKGGSSDSEHAREGTAAHALLERCLDKRTDPYSLIGLTISDFEVTEEMAEAVDACIREVRRWSETDEHAEVWLERRFDLAQLNPPGAMWGTADVVVWQPGQSQLVVIDFKYGKGVVVEAAGNPQLRYYGLGAVLSLPEGVMPEQVVLVVVQPRASHIEGIVRREQLPLSELLDFSTDLLAAARATQAPDAPLVPGEWCRWCRAAAVCPALHKQATAVAQLEFDDLDTPTATLPEPALLPKEVLLRVMNNEALLENWLRACRAYVTQQVELDPAWAEGQYKVVAKRANRKWKDEEAAVAFARDRELDNEDIYVQKIKTPAQLERLFKGKDKKDMQVLTVKASTGVTLVPETDSRPAVTRGAEFDALPPSNEDE